LGSVPRRQIQDYDISRERLLGSANLHLHGHRTPTLGHYAHGLTAKENPTAIPTHRIDEGCSDRSHATVRVHHSPPRQVKRRSAIEGIGGPTCSLRRDEELGINEQAQALRCPPQVG
jgi:hypothetical protein